MKLEIKIEKYVKLRIIKYACREDGSTDYHEGKEYLKEYDLPRELYERKQWVMRWRAAWFQCRYPRNEICRQISFYDLKSGVDLELEPVLNRLVSVKRMVTKLRNAIAEYEAERATELIWEKEYDSLYQKALSKLERYVTQRDRLQLEADNLKVRIGYAKRKAG
ncbi:MULTISPECIES: hypothetical protein [Olivibacter]|uniref:Uncharacterized protein n=1 Tax=Olivibacter oleidegradans TaxID=760123 RepID=A0ABV6HII9_9SPHI|nr:hypothetical protein [Olivibacter jilunii]